MSQTLEKSETCSYRLLDKIIYEFPFILQKVLVQWEEVRGLLLVKQAKPSVHLESVLKHSTFCVG